MIVRHAPHHKQREPKPDNYTVALRKALMFFNAQKSTKWLGKLVPSGIAHTVAYLAGITSFPELRPLTLDLYGIGDAISSGRVEENKLVAVSQLRNILGLGTREAEAISVDFTSKAYRKRLAIHEVFPSQSSDNNLLFFRNLQAEASTICSDGEPSDDNVAALLRVRVMLCIPQQTIEAANAEICGSIFEKCCSFNARSNFFWSEMVTNAETRKSVRKAAHGLLRLSERLPCLLLARLSVGFSQTIYQTSKSGREPQRR
uniref:Uncharacterized protein n=1 Tax=Brassica oleracea TaxID=3712 RepID=A0A3P6FZK0_BRAOL|nr:unnamed protein product [Brassica oleracea]